jgi:tRNA-(ms[2]io[6]A)-hydroxylase
MSAIAAMLAPSREVWVRAALADVDTLLVDHAHCERKAAQTALAMVAKHPTWAALVGPLSRLAREELIHFERVLRELRHRGGRLRALPAAGYAAALQDAARATREPAGGADLRRAQLRDEMLVCALIEARSHERFVRLAAATDDARLAKLYRDLLAAEERHGDLYLGLAREAYEGDVTARLRALAAEEARVIARPGQAVRMHAGG